MGIRGWILLGLVAGFLAGVVELERAWPSENVGHRMMAVANFTTLGARDAVGLKARLKAAATKSNELD